MVYEWGEIGCVSNINVIKLSNPRVGTNLNAKRLSMQLGGYKF